jgi:AICAR transformylase/IMP cyclohydrolase PurH
MTPLTVTLFARVGASEVMNEIGTVTLEATARGMTDAEREHAAVEAVAVVDINIPKMLRDAADEYEREHMHVEPTDPHEIVTAALAEHEQARRDR